MEQKFDMLNWLTQRFHRTDKNKRAQNKLNPRIKEMTTFIGHPSAIYNQNVWGGMGKMIIERNLQQKCLSRMGTMIIRRNLQKQLLRRMGKIVIGRNPQPKLLRRNEQTSSRKSASKQICSHVLSRNHNFIYHTLPDMHARSELPCWFPHSLF